MSMYIAFFTIWVIAFVIVYNGIKIDNDSDIDLNKFQEKKYNEMYRLSFGIPFKWFVEDDDNLTPKGEEIKEQLIATGYDRDFTVRSYMTYKVVVLMGCLILAGLCVLIAMNSNTFVKIMFDLETEVAPFNPKNSILIFAFWLLIALLPNFLLKSKVKKSIVANNKDVPVLQMFIILMLRSNKTIVEILFALSKLNTNHKSVFEQGYRIYIRNKQEGIAFLKKHFTNEKFIETFSLLEDIGEYAREDCIRILESNMKSIVDETATIKRRNDLSRLIYSQASMIIPFVGLITLGAIPVVVMGINMFVNSGMPM